jgi:hypothetical protein
MPVEVKVCSAYCCCTAWRRHHAYRPAGEQQQRRYLRRKLLMMLLQLVHLPVQRVSLAPAQPTVPFAGASDVQVATHSNEALTTFDHI